MADALAIVGVLSLTVAGGWRLCWPGSSARQRHAALIMVVLAASLLVNMAEVTGAVDRWSGIPDLAVLIKNLLALVVAYAAAEFVRSVTEEPARGWWPPRPAAAINLGVAAGMVALFAAAPRGYGGADFTSAHAGSAVVAGYGLLYQVCTAANAGLVAVRLRRQWRQTRPGPLRRSLLLIWVGAAAGVVYAANRMVFILSHLAGLHAIQGPAYVVVSTSLLGGAVLLIAAGGGYAVLRAALAWSRDLRSLWLLYPLWNDVCRVVPDVVLADAPHRVLDVAGPRAVRLRLYRRVIEIRDAQWALRGYVSGTLYAESLRLAGEWGLAGPARQAAADAAVLAIACRAAVAGPPASAVIPAEGWPVRAGGGSDLDGEVRRLAALAAATRSAFVRWFVAARWRNAVPAPDASPGR